MLGAKNLNSFRKSSNQLTKYVTWFCLTIGLGQAVMGIPSFFTLDPAILRTGYLGGLLLIYFALIIQGAVAWCLMLRKYVPIYTITLPVAIIGLGSWLYAVPRTHLSMSHHFITYAVPSLTRLTLGTLLICLFVSVGIYFLLASSSQTGIESRLMSFAFSLLYLGVGMVIGGLELVTGQVISRSSITADLVLTVVLLGVAAWPRTTQVKS